MKPVKIKLKELYKDNRKELVKQYKRSRRAIPYSIFAKVIRTYFAIKFEELFKFGDKISIRVPLIGGEFSIYKKVQPRSFHTLVDNAESKKQGRLVKYKVPILDDFYSLLVWTSYANKIGSRRVVFSRVQNKKKKEFVKKKGYDSFRTI